jgi:hypothetical protein
VDESEPVHESEFVYRRVHDSFFDAALPVPIRSEAFRPSEQDSSGLSVFRQRFIDPKGTLTNIDPAKASRYYVVRLAVRDLLGLGMTVVPEPTSTGAPGHAVIPELSWPAYSADKPRAKVLLRELAKLASVAIVYRPIAI